MNHKMTDGLLSILLCPQCGGSLTVNDNNVDCYFCRLNYPYSNLGSLDLRLQKPKIYKYVFNLGSTLLPESGFTFDVLKENDSPQVDYSDFDVPHHLSSKILSYFPRGKSGDLMLDLGCGTTIHKKVCEHAGFEYVGVDYSSEEAPILGDAHSLPFRDASFDFILSMAVLEHIRFPFVMMKEVYRVLKPNSVFIGSVAFLEPFHQHSFYHHTHLGIFNSLREGGFHIDLICPDDKWSVLIAQADMGLFPKMPRIFSRSIVMPIFFLHKIWWWLASFFSNKATEQSRVINTTGAFTFVARKIVL